MHDLYIDGNEEGPQIIAPTDECARDILDGFRMYALLCTYPFPHWLAFISTLSYSDWLLCGPHLAATG